MYRDDIGKIDKDLNDYLQEFQQLNLAIAFFRSDKILWILVLEQFDFNSEFPYEIANYIGPPNTY